jgi:undecaprenyl-diphosphatase
MSKLILGFVFSLGVFFLFILFSYAVAKEWLVQFDFDTTVRLQDKIPRRFDDLFSLFSEIGQFEIMLGFLLLLIVLLRQLWIIAAVLFFGLFHLVEIYGKYFVDQHPPPEFMLRTKQLFDFPQFHVRAEFSYPSGHAGRAAFLTVILCSLIFSAKRLSRKQKYILIGIIGVYDSIMFVSRVYLGEHWASDVIGGILLGTSMAFAAVGLEGIFAYAKKYFSLQKKIKSA